MLAELTQNKAQVWAAVYTTINFLKLQDRLSSTVCKLRETMSNAPRIGKQSFFKIPGICLLVLLIEVVLAQRWVNSIKEKDRQYTYKVNVARSLNIYTSFSILTFWYHFAATERFYGGLMSPATKKMDSVLHFFTFTWPSIVTNFFVIKPTRFTNFTNLFCHETQHISDSSSVNHQEFIHCTLSNGMCHTGL